MFRLYNPNSGEHFYTSSSYERSYCIYSGWCNEGVGWVAPAFSNSPVYRMYNPNAGDHHYTLSAYERDQLVRAGWIYEHIGWYSDDGKAIPVYRQYNPNASVGTHNFTTSKVENDSLVAVGWNAEGIGWYAVALGESVSPVEVNKVYLDAGHGMNNRKPGVWDSGAEGNGYYEANLTIQLVEKVASYARSTYGLDVYTNSNKGVSLWNRQSDAVNHNCTSLVSIHFNAGGGTGSESYSRESGAHVRSAGLQSIMHEQLVAGMGIADRGEKTDDLVVLRGLPSTLLEICFIDNAKDMDKYNANFDKLARKLAYGLFQAVHANY